MRLIARVTLWVTGVFLLLFGFSHSPRLARWVRLVVQRNLESSWGWFVTWRDLRASPFWTRVTLEGLVVGTDPETPPFLSVERIDLVFRWWRFRQPVSRIEIFGPTLRVVRTAPDRWNVPPLRGGGTWVHPLPTLVVHAGRFAGRDPWRTWAVELRSVRMDGTPVAMPGGTGYRFSTRIEGTLRWRATAWTPVVLTADVQIDPRMDAAFEANFRYDAPDGRGWTVYGVGRYHLLTGAWQVRMDGRFFGPPPASIERWATWEAYTGIPFRNLWTRRWTFHVSASDGPSIPVEVGLRPDGAAWQVRADCRVRSAESQCRVRLESPTGSPVQVEASVQGGVDRRWRLSARWDASWPGVGSRWPERWRQRPRLSGELALEGTGAAPFPTGGHARWEVAWPTATALWRHLGELTIPMPDRWLLRARLDRSDASGTGRPDELIRAQASVDRGTATWRLQATGRDWNEGAVRELLDWFSSYRLPPGLAWKLRPWRIEAEGSTDGRHWQARWSAGGTLAYKPWFPDMDVRHEGQFRQEGRRFVGQARLETGPAAGPYQSTWDLTLTGFAGMPLRWTLKGLLRDWPIPGPFRPSVEGAVAEATVDLQGIGSRVGPSQVVFRTTPLRYRGSELGPGPTIGVLEARVERAGAPVWRFYAHVRDGLVAAEGTGQWDERRQTLDWVLTGRTSVHVWWADARLRDGGLDWKLQGMGRLDVPHLWGELHWRDVRWNGQALGDWTLRIETPQARDYRLRVDNPVLGLRAETRWQGLPAGPARWDLTAELRRDGLAWEAHRWSYDARLHVTGGWPLRPDRPVEVLEVRLERLEWQLEGKPLLTLTQPVGISLDGERIRRVESGTWSGRLGDGGIGRGPDGLVVTHRVRLSELAAFWPQATGWTGEIAGSVHLPERWRSGPSGWTLAVTDLRGPHGYTMATCTLRGSWAAAVPEGGPCRLTRGQEVWELKADGEEVRLRLQNGEPGTWLTWWQPEQLLAPGRLDLTWVYRHRPGPRWSLEIRALELTYAATVLGLAAPLRVEWTPDRLSADLTPLTVNQQAVRLRFEVVPPGEKSPAAWLRPQAWRDWAVQATWEGPLDLAFMRPWFGWPIAGTLRGSFQVSGPLAHPLVVGELRMDDGEGYLPEWGLRFYPVRLQAQVRGLEDVRGFLEAASFRGHWRLEWQGGWRGDRRRWEWAVARWTAEDLLILGAGGGSLTLSGRLDLDTRVTPWVLYGDIRVREGVFTLPVRLPMLLTRSGAVPETPARPTAVPVHLNVRLRVERWDIRNNLAVLRSSGEWTVRGPVTDPVVDGEWVAEPGGTVTFQQRTYRLTQARLLWSHAAPWEPRVEVQMETTVPPSETTREPYRIQVGITGTLTDPVVRLNSDPPLPEAEILALVTGGGTVPTPREKVLAGEEDTTGSVRAVGQAMVMSLGGQAAVGLLQPVTRLLGIETVTVGAPGTEVQSVQALTGGTEVDPTARITVQRSFLPWLHTLFSIDARNTSRQTWIVSAQPWPWFQLRVARNDDASWVLGVLPQFVYPWTAASGWATGRGPAKAERAVIAEVRVAGDGPWSGPQTERLLGVRTGQSLDVGRIQTRARQLEEVLRRMGYWGAQVLWFLEPQPGTASAYRLHVQVRRGPRFEWVRTGWPADVTPPPPTRWAYPCWQGHTLIVWGQACMEAALATWARWAGWDPTPVRVGVRQEADRIVVETAWTGETVRRVPDVRWVWRITDGTDLAEDVVRAIQDPRAWAEACPGTSAPASAPYWWWLKHRPAVCERAWRAWAEERGWSLVAVERDFDPQGSRGTVTVTLHPRVIRRVEVEGLPPEAASVGSVLTSLTRRLYTDGEVRSFAEEVRRRLVRMGYPEAQLRWTWRPEEGRLQIHVEAGPVDRLETVEAVGRGAVRPSWLARLSGLRPGQRIRPDDLEQARRRVAALGVFQQVRAYEDLDSPPDRRRVYIEGVPRPLVQVGGGLRYAFVSRGGSPAFQGELSGQVRDPLGLGLQALGSLRLGRTGRTEEDVLFGEPARVETTLHQWRLGLGWGHLLGWPVQTNLFYLHDRIEESRTGLETGSHRTAQTVEQTWSVEQAVPVRPGWLLRYRYQDKDIREIPLDFRIHLRRLAVGLQWDARDAPWLPGRGHFLSMDVEYAPAWLKSDTPYVKLFFQGQRYWSWDDRTWTAVSGLRLGLAYPLTEPVLIPTERFFAGGPTSFRGLPTDALGPRDILGAPDGGEALVLVNLEVTRRLHRYVGIAGFLDVGNVFAKPSDIRLRLGAFREAAGIGLRLYSPVGLIRLDWAYLLDAQPGERRTRWSLALGPIL